MTSGKARMAEEGVANKSTEMLVKGNSDFTKTKFIIFWAFMGAFVIGLLIAVVVVNVGIDPAAEPEPEVEPDKGDAVKKPVSCVGRLDKFSNAALATDSEHCTQLGQKMMAEKETASTADVAIATLLCLGVVNLYGAGVGGGDFHTLYDKNEGKFLTLNAREVAPKLATQDMYVASPEKSRVGGLAVGVPGQFAGFHELHTKYGKLPWKDLFQPTIDMCKNGVPVSSNLAGILVRFKQLIKDTPELKEIFLDKATNEPVIEGQTVKMEKLAKTLELIAEGGADVFYKGALADTVVKEIKDAGGIISKDDLKDYKAIWVEPQVMEMNVRGKQYTMGAMKPPSSGILIEFILKTLNGLGLDKDSFDKDPVGTYHRYIEVSKYAYAARSKLGDSKFNDNSETMQNLTSDDYMKYTREHILDDATRPYQWYGEFSAKTSDMGTTHMSIVGKDGLAISSTSTINYYFGAKFVGDVTGIVYNNEMDDFSTPGVNNLWGFPPSESNFIEPGKRPMSSMSPIIIKDNVGNVRFVGGGSGGSKIITATAQVAARALLFDETAKTANDAARIYDQWLPPVTNYEKNLDGAVVKGLSDLGHKMELATSGAIVQCIVGNDGYYYPYADIRKGGCGGGV